MHDVAGVSVVRGRSGSLASTQLYAAREALMMSVIPWVAFLAFFVVFVAFVV